MKRVWHVKKKNSPRRKLITKQCTSLKTKEPCQTTAPLNILDNASILLKGVTDNFRPFCHDVKNELLQK